MLKHDDTDALAARNSPKESDLANNILRLYNQYPRSYANIKEMADDLPRIAAMGFNAVWVNPVHPCNKQEFKRGDDDVKGSLYAIVNHFEVDDKLGTKDDLKLYTETARNNNIIPLFDLVIRHVGLGCNIAAEHADWFIPYDNNKLMNDVIDFIYICEVTARKKDDYKNRFNNIYAKWKSEIFPYWQRYIDFMIKDMGFGGARIDAIRFFPPEIQRDIYQYITRSCQACGRNPIIFAELLFGKKEDRDFVIKEMSTLANELKPNYITNSLYYISFSHNDRKLQLWKGTNNDTPNILGNLSKITNNGGTIGFGGFHDGDPLLMHALEDIYVPDSNLERRKIKQQKQQFAQTALHDLKNNTTLQDNALKKMKEIIAAVAFTSNGGWYLMCGDEFGHNIRKSVFDNYKETLADWKKAMPIFDISDYIKTINKLLSQLPKPDASDWVEHIVLDNKPELMVIVKHHGSRFAKTSIILLNIGTDALDFNSDDLEGIAQQARIIEERKWGVGHGDAAYDNIIENTDNIIAADSISVESNHTARCRQ